MSSGPVTYTFGGFALHPEDRQLLHHGTPVPLSPKAFQTLLLLVQRHGHLVSKDFLLERLWPDTIVEEVAVAHCVSQIRKALGSGADAPAFIETVPKSGYRFIAPVDVVTVTPSVAPETRTRVAVLPVANLSKDDEREYIADGLTEEVIAAIGQVEPATIAVIGRTSIMTYKRTPRSLADIGAELGAEYLVESSLRGEGDRLRITSRLIRARDQVDVWSASYDAEPRSVLELQRELSTAIAHEVRLRIAPERMDALEQRQPRQVEAYDLYLRGRYFWNQLTPPTTRRAVELYSRAIEIDPDYALPWSGLAVAYAASPINGDAPPLAMWPRAREAAANALRLAPDVAETQTAASLFNFWLEWDWTAAEHACRRAVALDPNDGLAHRTLGILLAALMRPSEAQASMRRARELDPLDPTNHALSAQVAFTARDYATATDFARQASILNPDFWIADYQAAQAYERLGDDEMALDAVQRAAPFSHGNSKLLALRGYLLGKLGRTDECESLLDTLRAVSRERYVPPYAAALVLAGMGRREAALESLRSACDVHDVHLVLLIVDPKWDPFREDPRFAALIARCAFSGGRP